MISSHFIEDRVMDPNYIKTLVKMILDANCDGSQFLYIDTILYSYNLNGRW